jgi:hypothetical protein
VLQFESSRTLDDHEDYSRPIGGVGASFFLPSFLPFFLPFLHVLEAAR